MPIRQHLDDQCAFEPEAIAAMSKAFEQACARLHVFAADQRGREIVAARIIDLARQGVFDVPALANRVTAEARVSV
jgi:hypothetical protein